MDPDRNLSIFRAIGNVGAAFQFRVNFQGKNSDIDLVFLSEAMKKKVLRSLPVETDSVGPREMCPVYFDYSDPKDGPRRIIKAHILAESDLRTDEVPSCIGLALINSIGLVGWRPKLETTPLRRIVIPNSIFLFQLSTTQNGCQTSLKSAAN